MFDILAIIAGLLISPAQAQNITCATRPSADSSNACASTAFVHGVTGVGGSPTNLQFNNSGAFGGVTGSSVSGANIGLGGNLDIAPGAGIGVIRAHPKSFTTSFGGGLTQFESSFNVDTALVTAGSAVYSAFSSNIGIDVGTNANIWPYQCTISYVATTAGTGQHVCFSGHAVRDAVAAGGPTNNPTMWGGVFLYLDRTGQPSSLSAIGLAQENDCGWDKLDDTGAAGAGSRSCMVIVGERAGFAAGPTQITNMLSITLGDPNGGFGQANVYTERFIEIAGAYHTAALDFVDAVQMAGAKGAIRLGDDNDFALDTAGAVQWRYHPASTRIETRVGGSVVSWLDTSGNLLAIGNVAGNQLTSTVAIGTAPLIVTSTTQVANLFATKAATANAWTTARLLAGNSVDGSANVAFANKFIVQGTTDTGLSGAQFLGALGTGLVKNTTSTGILSIASAGTDYLTSVGVSFTGGLISVGSSPLTANGTIGLTVAGTSGGIPYFSSTSGWASSALLAANSIVIGGGAGAAPTTTTTGTGILTALGVNIGSAGAPVLFNGAGGTPSSIVLTNATGLGTPIAWTPTLSCASGGSVSGGSSTAVAERFSTTTHNLVYWQVRLTFTGQSSPTVCNFLQITTPSTPNNAVGFSQVAYDETAPLLMRSTITAADPHIIFRADGNIGTVTTNDFYTSNGWYYE